MRCRLEPGKGEPAAVSYAVNTDVVLIEVAQ
jgi:hypothetical protein